MKVSLNGYGESVTTFEAEDSVKAGYPVKMTDNGKVGLCTAKEAFCGIALNVRNGFAAVQNLVLFLIRWKYLKQVKNVW